MESGTFAKSALSFTKSPLGIIALFIVLVYGFASLVVGLGTGIAQHVTPLIYFMVFFPVLVFAGFLWLVAQHHEKLYGPADFKNEENFIKARMVTAASLGAASVKQPESSTDTTPMQVKDIVDVVSNTPRQNPHERRKKHVLWVDDRPDNNIYERQAFEAQGIEFSLALSTNEALELLKTHKFAAIISDMGRREGPQEGYVLLEKLRSMGDTTPFMIYAASNLPEHKRMAKERGAIGSTNRADELFQTVMAAVTDAL